MKVFKGTQDNTNVITAIPNDIKLELSYNSWTQPVMSANNTVGGTQYAARSSTNYETHPPYKAFNGTNTDGDDCWEANTRDLTSWLEFYSPSSLKITKITFKNRVGQYFTSYSKIKLSASNNGSNYTTISQFNLGSNVESGVWSVNISMSTGYKYFKFSAGDGAELVGSSDAKFSFGGITFEGTSANTLIMKSGTKLYQPNGANTFTQIDISSDKTRTGGSGANSQSMVFWDVTANGIRCRPISSLLSGTTAPTDYSTSPTWWDTSENKIKFYDSNGIASSAGCLPLCIITNDSDNKIASINQIFNGFGYLGSTIYAVIGVTGLIPNGKNSDNTNKITNASMTSIYYNSYSSSWTRDNQPFFLAQNSMEISGTANDRYYPKHDSSQDSLTYVTYYDTVENKMMHSGATAGQYSQVNYLHAGYVTITDGKLSNLRINSVKSATMDSYRVWKGTQSNTNVLTTIPNNINLEFNKLNATIYGTLSFNNGVVSGFSTTNYLKANITVPSTITSFEQVMKIHINDITSTQAFTAGDAYKGLGTVKVNSDSTIITYISSNGSSNDIASGTKSTNTVLNNTDYWVKFWWNGSTYKIDLSTNGTSYTNYISISNSNPPAFNGLLGIGTDTGASNKEPFAGTINLPSCYVKINGTIVWQGGTGTVKLKSGSKIFIPSGFENDGTTKKFETYTLPSDINLWTTGGSGACLIGLNKTSGGCSGVSNCVSGDGVTPLDYGMAYNTTTNKITRYGASGAVSYDNCCLPIALVTQTSGVITSINQIFNGFGCIGSTVFMTPGVKGLCSNGYNSDGTYKNISWENTAVRIATRTWDRSSSTTWKQFITYNPQNGSFWYYNHYYINASDPVGDTYSYWYNPATNITKYRSATTDDWVETPVNLLFYADDEGGTPRVPSISSISPVKSATINSYRAMNL